ncbi:MAG: hypothetical protein JNK02_06235 [Planctomycetes bacterium]|nr:hypothetical protein [Planctomycetota bacterium]
MSCSTTASAALAWALLSGCVAVAYRREIREVPPEPARVEAFEPGATHLGAVIDALGAPLYVWEGAAGGVVLAYGGLRTREWGVEVSIPLGDQGSASFAYDDAAARTRGHVLVFDPELRLALVRAGNLADLRQEFARRRPAALEEDVAEAAGRGGP